MSKAHPNASCCACGKRLIVVTPARGKRPRYLGPAATVRSTTYGRKGRTGRAYGWQEPVKSLVQGRAGWVERLAVPDPGAHTCSSAARAAHADRLAGLAYQATKRAARAKAGVERVLTPQEHAYAARYSNVALLTTVRASLEAAFAPTDAVACPQCAAGCGVGCRDMRPGQDRTIKRPHMTRTLAAVAAQGRELYWDADLRTWATRLYQGTTPNHTWLWGLPGSGRG